MNKKNKTGKKPYQWIANADEIWDKGKTNIQELRKNLRPNFNRKIRYFCIPFFKQYFVVVFGSLAIYYPLITLLDYPTIGAWRITPHVMGVLFMLFTIAPLSKLLAASGRAAGIKLFFFLIPVATSSLGYLMFEDILNFDHAPEGYDMEGRIRRAIHIQLVLFLGWLVLVLILPFNKTELNKFEEKRRRHGRR